MDKLLEEQGNEISLTQNDYLGVIMIVGVCVFIFLFLILRQKAGLVAGMVIRMICGVATIYVVNGILINYHISTLVGMNPISFLTSAILGIPGVCLLYLVLFL